MVSLRDSYIDDDFVFSTDEGLMIAFGLTAYDNEQKSIEDASYGRLKAYYKTWGLIDKDHDVRFEEVPSKECTSEQIGLPQ